MVNEKFPVSGEKLTAQARDGIHRPPDIIERMKKVLVSEREIL